MDGVTIEMYWINIGKSELIDLLFNSTDENHSSDRDPFAFPDILFLNYFKMHKWHCEELLRKLCSKMFYRCENDEHAVPFGFRVLATLSYLSHGQLNYLMHETIFNKYGLKNLVRCVPDICQKIVYFLSPTYISFPTTLAQICCNKKAFMNKFGCPGIVGILKSFYVEVTGSRMPAASRKDYINQFGQYAIKVQTICDHNLRFMDSNPRYPGSVENPYVWKHSHVQGIMNNLYEIDKRTWLIADQNYNLQNFVLTPYRNENSIEENLFNMVVGDVCLVWDDAVTLLRDRFSCLKTRLPYSHKTSANIITSCVTLHNFLITKVLNDENIKCDDYDGIPNGLEKKFNARSHEGHINRDFVKYFLHQNLNG